MAETVKPLLTKEQVEQLQKEGYIISNLANKEEEGEVLCKMCIKGKASKLRSLIDTLMSSYYYSGGSGYSKNFEYNLKVTILVEKVKDGEKT